MQKIVGVKQDISGKIFYYLPPNSSYNIGDKVVFLDNDLELLGTIIFKDKDIGEDDKNIPKIVRIATEHDLKKAEELKEKAKQAIALTRKKAKELKLDMKIISAEYVLDASKIIISFTAEDRVDFRDLLKELATNLKTRIELKQIGQRDEVKLVGGLGPCGEICCCTRFLKDFEHVTVKMAKNQGLSLSPTKISGLCGRLMCCLGYENPYYEEVLSRMPKVNSMVITPDGKGQVIYNDILREQVSVKFIKEDESVEIVNFPLADIKQDKKEINNGIQNRQK